jgi:hypothetical protein
MYNKGKKDIIDILYEMNEEIRKNPILEFLMIIKIIKIKCKNYKKKLYNIKKINDQYKNQHYVKEEVVNKIIALIESSKDYIDLSKKHLLTLGIKNADFFNIFEEKGMYKLYELVEELKNNHKTIEDEQVEIMLNFMIKILDKFKA